VIWGAIGPARVYSLGKIYSGLLHFFLDRRCNARHHVGYLEEVAQKGGLGALDQLAVDFRGHAQCAAGDWH
jgi:hypothetical protein